MHRRRDLDLSAYASSVSALAARTPVTVGIDQECTPCRSFAWMIRRLDWHKRITVDAAATPESPDLAQIPRVQRMEAMAVVGADGSAVFGFEAVRAVFARIPLLAPASAALAIISYLGFGASIYRFVASKRRRMGCSNAGCQLADGQ